MADDPEAWSHRQFERARSLLHDDVIFTGPIDSFSDAETYLASLRHLSDAVTGTDLLKTFVDGDDACVIYDLHTTVVPTARVCEWFRIEKGRIASISVVFDARPFAAMFAGGDEMLGALAEFQRRMRSVIPARPRLATTTHHDHRRRGMTAVGQDTKTIALRLAEEVLSKGDLDAFEVLFAENYVNHNIPVPGIPGTKDGFRELVKATRHAFPDVVVHVDDVIAEGDMVAFHDHVSATSQNEFFGVPPSGRRIEWTEIHWLRIAGGQIVEHWTNFDQLGILQQLGALGDGA